ncbi:MAG: chlorophyll a/b-binding protein [Elainellaceae cyanobacterium]
MTSETKPAVTEPSVQPDLYEPKFGFNDYAERLNGRAAMIGFVAALAVEYLSGQGVLSWLGLL